MNHKTKYNPKIHHRKSIRLKGYDYSQAGLYFVTICCYDRRCLFGKTENGKMMNNDAGNIANQCWLEIPNHFPNVILHEHIIMPNHIHGIIEFVGANNHSFNNNLPDNGFDDGAKNIKYDIGAENIANDNNNGAKNISLLRSPSKTLIRLRI